MTDTNIQSAPQGQTKKLWYYRREMNAALTGMAGLTLEERGAYNTVLDLIYAHGGAINDDAKFIARNLGCDVRVWKRIRQKLIDLGKLYVDGATLRNHRADAEVQRALRKLAQASKGGISSASKRAADHEVDPTSAELSPNFGRTYPPKLVPDSNEISDLGSTILESESELEKKERKKQSPADAGDRVHFGFEKFFSACQKKKGKHHALYAYARALKLPGITPELLYDAMIKQRMYDQMKGTDDQFVLTPTAWLNGQRWDDELKISYAVQPTAR